MEGQDYLNQISAKARPAKKEKNGILHSKFFIVGAIGLIGLTIIIILGAVLGSNKGGEKNLAIKLAFHLEATADTIETYQPNIKSSGLRSNSASLKSVLLDTNKTLTDYLAEKYQAKDAMKLADKGFVEEATTVKDGLMSELFEAKITGSLDRIFAHKMAYEISLVTSREIQLYKSTNNENLKGILDTSYNSLSNLYDKFNDFSETK